MEIDELERGRLRSKVLNFLKANDIEYKLYEHPALCSVEECLAYWGNIPEGSIVINYTPKACRIFTVEKDDRNFEARRGFYGK